MSPIPSARRSTISVAALIGAFALLLSGTAPVTATTGSTHYIDRESGSITIHKFAEPGSADISSTGQELDSSVTEDFLPLAGVTFTITNLGLELDTSDGWKAADGLRNQDIFDVVRDASSNDSLDRTEVVTGNQGTVSQNLPVGLYLVEETDRGDNNVVAPVTPFLVSLPTSGPENEWLYDVHAYPKNSVVGLDMKGDDSEALGMNGTGTIDWKIETTIPYMPADQPLRSYSIAVDASDHLTEPTAADVTLYVDEDPNPVLREWYSTNVSDEGILTLTPNLSSDYLNEHQGKKVRVVVATKMTANDDEKGIVRANAWVNVNGESSFKADAESEWGAVRVITKTKNGEPLAGVSYQLWTEGHDEPIEVEGSKTFTTDENGELIIAGVRVGHEYRLVESGTPAGYRTGSDERFQAVVADTTQVAGDEGHENVITFEKTQVSGFALPITGSFGSLPFLLAGLLLVATALIVNRSRRRRLARAV